MQRALRGTSGSATLEVTLFFAFVAAPLLLGTADVGCLVYDSIEVSNAAHAGAMYGMMSATAANNNTMITSAAQGEAADISSNLTVTPSVYYVCSAAEAGTQYSTEAAAASACTGTGNHALEYVQVIASSSVTPPVHFPLLPASYRLSSTSVMEVEE